MTNDVKRPATMQEMDTRDNQAWMYSFAAAMVPFTSFCYAHSRGVTTRVVERMARSRMGVYGLLALPFCTLAMEKSVYDSVQAWQGIDPNVRPADRGGFPSGGAGTCLHGRTTLVHVLWFVVLTRPFFVYVLQALPSFSLIPVQKREPLLRRITSTVATSPN